MLLHSGSILLRLSFTLLPAFFVPLVLPRISNPLRFYCFLAYNGLSILVSAIYCSFAHVFFYLIGRHDLVQYTTARLWWYLVAPFAGLTLDIEGEELLQGWGGSSAKGPCVFVLNHQSELDVLICTRLWQPHSVACAAWRVRKMPVLGLALRLCRTIFIDPPSHTKLTNKIILANTAEMLNREGMNLFMFPEGVLSYSKKPSLLPFKRGAVAIAVEAGYFPIVPVVIANSSHVFHVPGKHFRSGTVRVRILPPVETKKQGLESKDEAILRVLEEVRVKMLRTLEEIS